MDMPIDDLLSQWKTYLTNISTNLMELSDQIEYQLIKSRFNDTANGYIGITKARAEQCIERMGTLWHQYALLSEVIEKAVSMNNKQSFLYNTEEDVRKLIETTLIVIEKEHIDINERNLISDEHNEKKATPKELLKYMQDSFGDLCKDVEEIWRADETVGNRLSNIKTEIAKLSSKVKHLGITNVPGSDVDKITEIERDPLKGSIELDKLVYSIEKYRVSIKSVEQDYRNIVETLKGIRDMLSELNDLALKSKNAVNESKNVFGVIENIGPIISDDVLKSLQDWLLVLENKLSEGSLNAVKIGVCKLEQECSSKLEIERKNYYINSKDYNEWLDLKGQFKALLVKADILRARNLLIDNSLNKLVEDTRVALYAKSVELNNCRSQVRKLDLTLKG